MQIAGEDHQADSRDRYKLLHVVCVCVCKFTDRSTDAIGQGDSVFLVRPLLDHCCLVDCTFSSSGQYSLSINFSPMFKWMFKFWMKSDSPNTEYVQQQQHRDLFNLAPVCLPLCFIRRRLCFDMWSFFCCWLIMTSVCETRVLQLKLKCNWRANQHLSY